MFFPLLSMSDIEQDSHRASNKEDGNDKFKAHDAS
jgi:hypothetical protein